MHFHILSQCNPKSLKYYIGILCEKPGQIKWNDAQDKKINKKHLILRCVVCICIKSPWFKMP